MNEFNFRVLFDAPTELSDDDLNRLFEATGGEATVSSDGEGWSAEFDRTAPDIASAVLSALKQIAKAGYPVRRVASEAEVLVNASEISRRTGKTREAVRLWVQGERQSSLGAFPAPVASLANGERIWQWGDVAPWLSLAVGKPLVSNDAEFLIILNEAIDITRRMPRLETKAQKAIDEMLEGRLAVAR